jgi:hypothetical protein
MSPRLLRPRSTGFHPEAQVWRNAVIANGGTVSGSTLAAVSQFCLAIDAAGIRDRFYRLNLFCGNGLSAALVPLYRGPSRTNTFGNTTDVAVAFVGLGTDYTELGSTGGLTGNGSTKYLQTGLAPSAWIGASAGSHLAAYKNTSTNSGVLLSSRFNPADSAQHQNYEIGAGGNHAGGNTGSYPPPGTHNSLLGVTREPGGASAPNRAFRNTLLTETNAGGNAPAATSVPIAVFARNSQSTDTNSYSGMVLFSNQRLSAYSVGTHLSSAALTSYNTAMQAFQTALGRNV